jgi:hypothetical protein
VSQPACHLVPHHGTPDRLAHHETGPRARRAGEATDMDHQPLPAAASATAHDLGELVPVGEPGCGRQHRGGRSGGQAHATLAATRSDDGASGPGPHPQPEAVRTRAAADVRLKGALALAHVDSPARPGETAASGRSAQPETL